jgi:hypothetical protein
MNNTPFAINDRVRIVAGPYCVGRLGTIERLDTTSANDGTVFYKVVTDIRLPGEIEWVWVEGSEIKRHGE